MSELAFEGKTVWLTGGSAGIGAAVAAAFCAAGARVAFADVQPPQASCAGARHFACDVGNAAQLAAFFDGALAAFGAPDIFVHNAGIGADAPFEELSLAQWQRVMDVNLRAGFLGAQRFARECGKGGGAIVFIASTRAFMSEAHTEAYSASKGALVALTHALAMSLAPKKIRVNSISPGWIFTRGAPLRPEDHAQHPSGRVGRVDDIARAALFLCDARNDFINAENLVVDGGMTRKMIYVP